MLDGNGNEFFSRGVNVIKIGPSLEQFNPDNPAYSGLKFYPSSAEWASATVGRLQSWGFDTIGGYSSHDILNTHDQPYTIVLTMGGWIGVPWLDIRAPEAKEKIAKLAQELVKYRDDPLLIGYFIDNELEWWDEALFKYIAVMPWNNRIKRRLWEILNKEYLGDLRLFKRDFAVEPRPTKFDSLKGKLKNIKLQKGQRPLVIERFTEFVAEEYYSVVTDEVRKSDPNHLILCDRFASFYSQPVAKVAGRYCDVISTNYILREKWFAKIEQVFKQV